MSFLANPFNLPVLIHVLSKVRFTDACQQIDQLAPIKTHRGLGQPEYVEEGGDVPIALAWMEQGMGKNVSTLLSNPASQIPLLMTLLI